MKISRAMTLPLPLGLALRYLRSSRRDAYVSFLSALAGGGIALGVAALILILAALSGLQDFLRGDVLARTPHLEIELPESADLDAVLAEIAAVDGVVDARRLLRGRGWLLIGGSPVAARLVGYEGALPQVFDRPPEMPRDEGIYLPELLAARWGLEAGDAIELVSPRPTMTPLGPQPRIVAARLTGTFRPGKTEDDEHRIAVPLNVARRLFGDGRLRIEARTLDLDAALRVAPAVDATLPDGGRLETWKDTHRALFFALSLEKRLMFAAVFLIVPVAAMALVTVLTLLVSAKRSEIGILHAMGATPRTLSRAFLTLGAGLAVVGLLAGGLLGIAGALVLDATGAIAAPGDAYYLSHVPFLVEGGDLVAVVVATLVVTGAATLWAARRAATLDPLDALRTV
ncbi:MAG: FtsX-like permease family protein [Acidobacteriota bacterium]